MNIRLQRVADNLVEASKNRGVACLVTLLDEEEISTTCALQDNADPLIVISEIMRVCGVRIEEVIEFQSQLDEAIDTDL